MNPLQRDPAAPAAAEPDAWPELPRPVDGWASRHLPETAARHLATAVPLAHPGARAGAILRAMRGRAFEVADAVYLVDRRRRLRGVIPIEALFSAPTDSPIDLLALPPPPPLRPADDQERAATLALQHHLTSMPVVGDEGKLFGVVPARSLLGVLRREHVEDLHRLAGIQREEARAVRAIEAAPARRARDRLPWLLVGAAGSVVAAMVVSRFEGALSARIAVAYFIPTIVYLADAIGTQTEAIAVRGLSLTHAPFGRILGSELTTGALIGLVLGGALFPVVALAFGDARLAIAVAVAVFAAGTVATAVGLLFPWILAKAGIDPAFGSGPVATVIQDVLSLVVYLGTVTAAVR